MCGRVLHKAGEYQKFGGTSQGAWLLHVLSYHMRCGENLWANDFDMDRVPSLSAETEDFSRLWSQESGRFVQLAPTKGFQATTPVCCDELAGCVNAMPAPFHQQLCSD